MRGRRRGRPMIPARARDWLWALLSVLLAGAAIAVGLTVPPTFALMIGAAACVLIIAIARR